MIRNAVGAFLLVLASLTSARAAEVVAFDEANPPFMSALNGKPAGIYPALVQEAFKRMGTEVTIQTMPWTRVIAGIDEGKSGVGGIYQNAERLKKYDYSEKIFEEVIQVFVAKAKPFAFAGVESLKGKTVGVIRGWSYGDAFDSAVKSGAIKAEETESDTLNLKKLALGRIDAVLAVRESGAGAIASETLGDKVAALDPPLSSSPTYLAFAKSAGKTDLLARFNEAIAAMRADGSFDKVVSEALSAK